MLCALLLEFRQRSIVFGIQYVTVSIRARRMSVTGLSLNEIVTGSASAAIAQTIRVTATAATAFACCR